MRRAGRLRRFADRGQPGPGRHLRRLGQLLVGRHHLLPAGQRDPAGVRPDPADRRHHPAVVAAAGRRGCTGYEFTRTGSLSSGGSVYQPDNSYYQSTVSGTHRGCLAGPSGTDFDLYLQKWNGSAWANVASGTTSASSESITYSGTAGYYRYRVYAYSGSGSYTLGFSNP
ncbi:hypothetical protein ACFQY4_33840 [Catellatospora bangladeshensis]|uniref:hypothetical protein n=1 Tax=Catellatospora bangladeshensis TaxID=310355 RepID=UPI003614B91E